MGFEAVGSELLIRVVQGGDSPKEEIHERPKELAAA